MAKLSLRSVRWWRVTLALAIFFGFLILAEEWFGPYYVARTLIDEQTSVLPVPLADNTTAVEPETRVKRGDISFAVPEWTETAASKHMSGALQFTNGLVVFIGSVPSSIEVVRTLKGVSGAALRHELGDEAVSSEFDLASAAAATSNNDAKWWRGPFYNGKVSFLLAIKAVFTGSGLDSVPAPIYTLRFGNIRGFQIGSPAGNQQVLRLVLYRSDNRACSIELLNFRSKISQPQINALIASLRFD